MGKVNESELMIENDVRRQRSLLDLRKVFKNYNVYRSLPSSTFQKETSAHAGAQSEKRPLIFNERLRVSAAPRMSDISEHVVMEKNITPNLLSHKASSFQQQQLPTERQDCVVLPKQLQNRRSSVRSTGKDSGCGSLTPPIPSYRFQCFPTESST
ncbi:hypothetical protein WUBG_15660 [Wuchereria bancrofti]|uniref:Uncharacterized protein n=1 Tax=Wuchereria bancrofti TaxID=6293 RepID=J9AH27_WUCBA|nr:hypothetical protein WUBG_15660 [Wuchereria bancrofti]